MKNKTLELALAACCALSVQTTFASTSNEGLKSPAVLAQVVLREESAQGMAVRVDGAWLRATVPGQHGTGGFMKLTARENMQLVGVSTPVAGVAEVHEMKMEGSVMKMRPIAALALPAGKTVELSPGGYHLMLMDLKQALPKDSTVPLTLVFQDAKGAQSRMELKVPVTSMAPMGGHKH